MQREKRKNVPQDDGKIPIGKSYMVLRKPGDWRRGTVLHKKFNRSTQKLLYYVHFENMDKRLDQWVSEDRILFGTCKVKLVDISQGGHVHSVGRPALNESEKPSTSRRSRRKKLPSRVEDKTEMEREELTKIKYINTIQLGIYEIDTWYYSPYPEKYEFQEQLFICEFCLIYMSLESSYCYHLGSCPVKVPPGDLIYEHNNYQLYEVDPINNRLYCQNLSLMAKLFIDHKTIFYDIDSFLFYVLCESDDEGVHIRGYFSKEKGSPDGFNVACILVLPPFQRQGLGKLLIGLSYELSKIEETPGTPETPLSDLGKRTYLSFWSWAILRKIRGVEGYVTIEDISKDTGITSEDIIYTLQALGLIKYFESSDTACIPPSVIEKLFHCDFIKEPRLHVEPNKMKWTPKY